MGKVACFIGIDPGPTTGMAVAYWDAGWKNPQAYQCDIGSARQLLSWILRHNTGMPLRAQVEEFRLGTGPGARGKAASATRSLSEDLALILFRHHVPYLLRPAAEVKPWSSGKRLENAGLAGVTSGMPQHARDAMRHLLFTAVSEGGVPDPLSKGVHYRVVRETG